MDKLIGAQSALDAAEAAASEARQARDAAILEAHAGGVSMYRIAQVLGISQQAVGKIVQRATG